MTSDQKNELILKLLDDDISKEEFQHLQDLLLSDPETLELYHEHVVLDRLLVKAGVFSDLESQAANSKKKALLFSVLVGAACLVMFLVIALFIKLSPTSGADLRFVQNSSFTLTSDGNDRLEPGESLDVERGAVELRLTQGVQAVIMAPAKLKLKDDQTLLLNQGKASFHVSPEGKGFTVITPRPVSYTHLTLPTKA